MSGFWASKTQLEQVLLISTGFLALLSFGLLIGLIVESNKTCGILFSHLLIKSIF